MNQTPNTQGGNPGNTNGIQPSDYYKVLTSLIISSEEIRWTRFNNLLIANSVLIIAWASIYISGSSFSIKPIVMTVICIPGLLASILFAFLGERSSSYHDKFCKLAVDFEKSVPAGTLPGPGPHTEVKPIRQRTSKGVRCLTSSRFIVHWGPVAFALLYAGLIIFSWLPK